MFARLKIDMATSDFTTLPNNLNHPELINNAEYLAYLNHLMFFLPTPDLAKNKKITMSLWDAVTNQLSDDNLAKLLSTDNSGIYPLQRMIFLGSEVLLKEGLAVLMSLIKQKEINAEFFLDVLMLPNADFHNSLHLAVHMTKILSPKPLMIFLQTLLEAVKTKLIPDNLHEKLKLFLLNEFPHYAPMLEIYQLGKEFFAPYYEILTLLLPKEKIDAVLRNYQHGLLTVPPQTKPAFNSSCFKFFGSLVLSYPEFPCDAGEAKESYFLKTV